MIDSHRLHAHDGRAGYHAPMPGYPGVPFPAYKVVGPAHAVRVEMITVEFVLPCLSKVAGHDRRTFACDIGLHEQHCHLVIVLAFESGWVENRDDALWIFLVYSL